jgi:hypothetical protein
MKPVMFCRNSRGYASLGAELHEVRALHRGLGEQDAVVGDDADGVAVQPGEAADQRVAVERLELVEGRVVDEAGDHLADVEGLAAIRGNDAVQVLGR